MAWLSTRFVKQQRALNMEIGNDMTAYFLRMVMFSFSKIVCVETKRMEEKVNRLISSNSWEFTRRRNYHNELPNQRRTMEKGVVNLSSRTLTTVEQRVLAKGLNFGPTPNKIDYLDVMSRVELGISKEAPSNANQIRSAIANCLTKQKYSPTRNLTKTEVNVIKKLKDEESIIITKADKGNVVVVMDRETYNNKVEELLNTETYKSLGIDPTDDTRKSLAGIISSLVDTTNEKKLAEFLNKLRYGSNFSCPELFCLPKIHKENVPLRPVVSSCNSVTRELCVYLTNIL